MTCSLCREHLEKITDLQVSMFQYISYYCTECNSTLTEIYRFGDFIKSEWSR